MHSINNRAAFLSKAVSAGYACVAKCMLRVCVAAFEGGTDIADTRVRRYDGRRNPIPTATYQDRFLRRVPYIRCLQTVK